MLSFSFDLRRTNVCVLFCALDDPLICWWGRISFLVRFVWVRPVALHGSTGLHTRSLPTDVYVGTVSSVSSYTCTLSHVCTSLSVSSCISCCMGFYCVFRSLVCFGCGCRPRCLVGWFCVVVFHASVPRTSLFRFVLVGYVPSASTGGARGSSWLRRGSLITTRRPPALAMVGTNASPLLPPSRMPHTSIQSDPVSRHHPFSSVHIHHPRCSIPEGWSTDPNATLPTLQGTEGRNEGKKKTNVTMPRDRTRAKQQHRKK